MLEMNEKTKSAQEKVIFNLRMIFARMDESLNYLDTESKIRLGNASGKDRDLMRFIFITIIPYSFKFF